MKRPRVRGSSPWPNNRICQQCQPAAQPARINSDPGVLRISQPVYQLGGAKTASMRKLFQGSITGDRYRLQSMRLSRALKEKRPLYAQRHDNARPHVAKPVITYIAPSDFHLFRSIAHGLADRRFHSYEEAQKWIDSWIASKDMSFFRRGIHVLPERWSKVVESDGKYFH
ncbi:MOS1T transposase, partial [Pseudoatta argentina]